MKVTILFGTRAFHLIIKNPKEGDTKRCVDNLIEGLATRYKIDLIEMMHQAIQDEISCEKHKIEYEMKMKEQEKKLKELNWFQKILIKIGNIEVKQLKGPRK